MADSSLSKHVQTIVVSCATGALAWVAFSIQELKVEVAVLSEKVDQLEQRTFASNHESETPVPDPLPMFRFHALPANYSEPRLTRK